MNLVISITTGAISVALSLAALRRTKGQRSWRFPVTLLSLGWAIGNLSRTLRPFLRFGPVHVEALLTLILLVLISLWLIYDAFSERPRAALARFELNAIALWTSFVSGWSSVHQQLWDDLLIVSAAWCAGCCLFGGITVYQLSRRRWSKHSYSGESPKQAGSSETQLRQL